MIASVIMTAVYACPAPILANDEVGTINHKKLNERFEGRSADVYYGGLLISAGETISGSIVVMSGSLDIQEGGVLDGEAWIINGELIMSGSARVTGSVTIVNGQAYFSREASIGGGVTRYDCECALDTDHYDEASELRFIKEEDPEKVRTKVAVGPPFPKRVNYDIIRVGLRRWNDRHRDPYVRGHVMVHVPLWGKYYSFFGVDAEVLIPLFGDRSDIVLRAYKQAATRDYWQLPRGESSLNLFLLGKDYPDYYEQRGGQFGLNYRLSETFRIEPMFTLEEDLSLQTNDVLSIGRDASETRPNPPVDEGTVFALSFLFEYDSRGDEKAWPHDAWFAQLWVEKGFNDGPGEFSYEDFYADLRWYNKLPLNLQWDMRARMFSTFTEIPRQSSQSLNGFGGIRGTGDQPFDIARGNRLFLFTSEWRYTLPETPIVRWFFTQWNFLVFTDIGLLAQAENPTAPLEFLEAPFDEWRKSAGIGISGESFFPYLGIYVAKDLDGGREWPRLIVRINRSF